ncbi:MAG: dTMP kinase [Thermaerobacterales bacterium]
MSSAHHPRGLFITVEGGERAGKSTQLPRIQSFLDDAGCEVIVTREPGGTEAGEMLRHMLLHDQRSGKLTPLTETLLMGAARAEHLNRVIGPALAAGKVVLCDRFIDSTVAYQGYGLGVNLDLIDCINRAVTGTLLPDLTLLFDLAPEIGAGRPNAAAPDRVEQRDQEFHQRVRQGYLRLAAAEPDRIKVIHAARPVDEVTREATRLVARLLSSRRPIPRRPGI